MAVRHLYFSPVPYAVRVAERGTTWRSAMELERDICSAKGCQVGAAWDLQWNNPKIHTPERRKSWLACDEHRVSLSDFLGARGFLKDVVAHDAA